jgi:hypothetical protein
MMRPIFWVKKAMNRAVFVNDVSRTNPLWGCSPPLDCRLRRTAYRMVQHDIPFGIYLPEILVLGQWRGFYIHG